MLCSAPARGERGRPGAEDLARQLVEERLCACASVVPGVRSFFRWQGRCDFAEESLLVVKTTAAMAARLADRIVELHPYEVPEVLQLPVAAGLPAYLRWLVDSVASQQG
ncbi:MAG: divalent-cation tolerance protein CutA [Planctomycetes bacterium]|nr:divalent-cation tolerance protein CutA [Planctomycetota bacterium]